MRTQRLLVVLALVATGCSVRGGDPGLPGQDNLSFVWKDATGAQVTAGRSLQYVDAAGHLWPLDPETAQVVWEGYAAALWLENDDCTGTAYTAQWPPRRVLRLWGETVYRARLDTQQAVEVVTRSLRNSAGDCLTTGDVQQLLVAVAGLSEPLPAPALAFAPPLRLEPR